MSLQENIIDIRMVLRITSIALNHQLMNCTLIFSNTVRMQFVNITDIREKLTQSHIIQMMKQKGNLKLK